MRRAAAALAAGCLLAAVPARAEEARSDEASPVCGADGRCLGFPAGLDPMPTASLWRRVDPLALATGTPGDPVEGLPDDD